MRESVSCPLSFYIDAQAHFLGLSLTFSLTHSLSYPSLYQTQSAYFLFVSSFPTLFFPPPPRKVVVSLIISSDSEEKPVCGRVHPTECFTASSYTRGCQCPNLKSKVRGQEGKHALVRLRLVRLSRSLAKLSKALAITMC